MSSALNKRQQARNEKALQELIRTVPGNDRCADCDARNPGWASWSLGIFLCMRCAALHRKLGTHVSKVKSLSMDSWANEQVENMRKIGNTNSNKDYNPSRTKPPIPLDVDEIDPAMERFIRQKYIQKAYMPGASARLQVPKLRSTDFSDPEDVPPVPPPKPGRRFGIGFRSSSAAPFSSKGQAQTPNKGPTSKNKPSRVFGASIGVSEEGMEWKLVTLKDMGFADEERNSHILKGLNGDLQRAIDSLVKLGEGPNHARSNSPLPPIPQPPATTATIQSQAPSMSTAMQSPGTSQSDTETLQSITHKPLQAPRSNNPFDVPLSSAPSQFLTFESSFQNLSADALQPQPLFPNATGGYTKNPDQMQQIRLQQSMTPPVPHLPQQFVYNNPYNQQPTHNPFMRTGTQMSEPANMAAFAANQNTLNNPFMIQANFGGNAPSPGFMQSPLPLDPMMVQPPQQQQQHHHLQQNPAFSPSFPQQAASPSVFQSQANVQSNQTAFQQQSPAQPLVPQQTGRFDKATIMSLYNYPQLAPKPTTSEGNSLLGSPAVSVQQHVRESSSSGPMAGGPQQRSVTMPVSGSRNPFLSQPNPPSPAASTSQSSIQNAPEGSDSGRHSPDAFASLSARFMR